MFNHCYKLIEIPEILPAINVAERCYASMFYDYTSLAKAPMLPIETSAEDCRGGMLEGCANLVEMS